MRIGRKYSVAAAFPCLLLILVSLLSPNLLLADYVRIRGSVVNVRQGPGTSFPVLFQAQQGEEFNLLRTEGLWYLVKLPEGEEAWVFGRLADIVPGAMPGQPADGEGAKGEGEAGSGLKRILEVFLLLALLLLSGIAVWKRKQLTSHAILKLKEISGYRREQPFRYDNRMPKDDSWEI
ncbi:MAG: SH3 domain-containing protein [bacterium]|nr:MAG: SH3 domain-containing protein [bacterium]